MQESLCNKRSNDQKVLQTFLYMSPYIYGIQTIAPEENCPSVRVRVWFSVTVRIMVGGQFSLKATVLEPVFTRPNITYFEEKKQ